MLDHAFEGDVPGTASFRFALIVSFFRYLFDFFFVLEVAYWWTDGSIG